MKKVSNKWQQYFADLPAEKFGRHLFAEFEDRAKSAAAEVFPVKTAAEAREAVANLAKYINAKNIVIADSLLQQAGGIAAALGKAGLAVYSQPADIAEQAEKADMGISTVEFGIAETGSVCQDAYAIESRLVSALPPVHVAFLNSNHIVAGVTEAMEVIAKAYDRGYISFITGPSRTADIERVLTIGVHGPKRFIIVAIDIATDIAAADICGGDQ
ncbi:MAG TPA: lactate utilization protein [Methylomusa anaerophila]|uniref:Lactate utilization protein C n=1 Tax=Methylomusa anaerophila TaxID=1930071 RepID=A0A348AFR4_9FIRM|nr:lactate utilization protein [Methylomusa anaerophila]BBB89912.1 lactate utilization protein C [Methylomusa anaerophila]HML90572.1 lactate utilization protein [Methylomusa anaerophila]